MSGSEEVLDDLLTSKPVPKLYGKGPVIWYSFLFSPIVGGVLMTINLWRLQKKNTAVLVLLGSLIYSLGVGYFGFTITLDATSRLVVLLLNLMGGNMLGAPVWRNTIGRMRFQRANPWIPLFFVLAASLVLWLLAFVGLSYFINY
jgi:hypothetical protein